MELSNALTWTVVNRVLTFGAMVAGIGLVLLGFVLGFWGAIELLIEDPLNPSPAIDEASPVLTLVFVVVGFLVWQVGKTYALFRTLPKASGRAAARRFDYERAKSEVLEGLDGRLTKIEEDLEETRRSVHELKRAEHANAFDFDEADADDDASEPAATESTSESSATTDPETPSTTAKPGVSTDGESSADDLGPSGDEEFSFGESTEDTSTGTSEGNADTESDGPDAERRSTDDTEDDPLA